MDRFTNLSGLRTESDIKLAKANLRHSALLQERVITDSFRNFGEYFVNSVKIAAMQAGTSIITTALARIIHSLSD